MSESHAPERPRVKGSIILLGVEKLKKLVAEHEVSRAEVARRLSPEYVDLLGANILASKFYDVAFYGQCLELLKDVEGGGRNEYLTGLGAENAQRLLDSNIYQQMDYAKRVQVDADLDAEGRSKAFGRSLRLMNTMAVGLYTVFVHEMIPDPDHPLRFMTEIRNAREYPDAMAWTSQGFRNRMAAEHDHPDLWYWQRPEPDRLLMRMNQDV